MTGEGPASQCRPGGEGGIQPATAGSESDVRAARQRRGKGACQPATARRRRAFQPATGKGKVDGVVHVGAARQRSMLASQRRCEGRSLPASDGARGGRGCPAGNGLMPRVTAGQHRDRVWVPGLQYMVVCAHACKVNCPPHDSTLAHTHFSRRARDGAEEPTAALESRKARKRPAENHTSAGSRLSCSASRERPR